MKQDPKKKPLPIPERNSSNALTVAPNIYRELAKSVPAVLWRADAKTFQFTFVSAYAETLLGYPVQSWQEPNFWKNHIHPEDRDGTVRRRSQAVEEGGDYDLEYRMVSSDGRALWVRELGRAPAKDQSDELTGVIVDLSQKRSTQRALGEDKLWLRQVFDTIPVQIWSATGDGMLDFWNARWRSETGLSQENLQSEGWQQIFHPADRERVVQTWHRSVTNGTPYCMEARRRMADGQYRWFLSRGVALREEGKIVRWFGANCDIDDQKQAEHAVQRTKEYLRQVIDTIPQHIWSGPADGSLDFCNARLLNELGLTPKDIEGDGWQQVLHPDDRDRVVKAWQESVGSGARYEVEFRVRIADGRFRWFLVRGVPLRDENGQITRWFGTGTDIEVQKQAEDALRKSEQRWRGVFENTRIGVALLDASLHFIDTNEAYRKMMGYSTDELRSLKPMDLTVEEDRPSYQQLFDEMSAGKRDHFDIEKCNIRKDGETIWVRSSGSSFISGENRLWIVMVTDISQRKRAEEHLRESETRLREFFKYSPNLIFMKDPQGRYLYANQEVERVLRLTEEQIKGKRDDELFPQEHAAGYQANDLQVLQAGTPMEFEEIFVREDGLHTTIATKFPLFNAKGEVYAIGGVATDITERKRTEDALQKSERRWRGVFDNSNVGVALHDQELRFIDANPAVLQMSGYTIEELRNTTCMEITYEEDKEKYKATIGEMLSGKHDHFELESRYVRKNGELIWARVNGSMIQRGESPLWVVIAEDITERKRLQDQLHRERDRLRLLLDLNLHFISKLELPNFFDAVATGLHRVEGWDGAAILLPEPSGNELQIYLTQGIGDPPLEVGTVITVDGTIAGKVYKSVEPEIFRFGDLAAEHRQKEWYQNVLKAGLKVGCALPLVQNDHTLGVLVLATRRDQESATHDLSFLQELAKLVAVSLSNSLRYEQVNQSCERLVEAKNWIEDQIRTEFSFETVVGASQAIRDVLKQVETVAPTDSTVLILGETGTGKELVARAIHNRSTRSNQSFIKVDCSAIPATLMESELFGHEKGAFTGATALRLGRFEIADKGTLFLDEIGDVPLELQPKLLRVLQDQAFERLGSNRTRHVDVRIIAATHRDLEKMVEKGEFREDLYYRLKVFPITIPPLRERPDDIPPLVKHYVAKYAQRMKKPALTIPAHAMEVFTRYPWPGNVRELQHFLERSVVLSPGNVLQAPLRELEQVIRNRFVAGKSMPRSRTMEEIERDSILQALRDSNWVVGGPNGAAAKLGLKRTTLASRMENLGISRHRK